MGAVLIMAGGYFLNSLIASLYWWTSFLLTGTLFIGMWSLAEKSFHFRHSVDEEVQYDVEAAEQLVKARHEDGDGKELVSYKPSKPQRTVFFQDKAQENILHQPPLGNFSGPKLYNVKVLDASKRHSITRRSLLRYKTKSSSKQLKKGSKSSLKKKKSKSKSKVSKPNSRLVRWKSAKKRVASSSKKQSNSKQFKTGSKRKKSKLQNQSFSKRSLKLNRYVMI